MLSNPKKRPLCDLTNVEFERKAGNQHVSKVGNNDVSCLMPQVLSADERPCLKVDDNEETKSAKDIFTQNIHPALAMYHCDGRASPNVSWTQLQHLLHPDEEDALYQFLTDQGLIAVYQQCEFCGSTMNKVREGGRLLWMCRRMMRGSKCNRGKKSVKTGTIFADSKLTVQQIVSIFYHFVHRLSETQCAQYVCISSKSPKTLVKWYKMCREVCNAWFWDPANTPKLGGFGTIVEMDETYLPGQPKYHRGRRLGTTWKPEDKWALGLTQRGSLDAIVKQVPFNRARHHLVPIIESHTLPGTIYCSDSWKGYVNLPQFVNLEDTSHFTVNHSKNYVDPETGAHTETIEGMWKHMKDFLPNGMAPKDAESYIGVFLWHRYCKQRKLDVFVHFLKCCASIYKPTQFCLPSASMSRMPKQQPPPYDDDFES